MELDAVDDAALEEILASVHRRFSLKPRVAIAGFGKAGKSSLFNALYGERVAAVSMRTDQTLEAQTRERFGIDFTDTPGLGTGLFSFERLEELAVFDGQHVVVHLLNAATAISAEDLRLHDAVGRSKARRITAVNKADLLDERECGEFAQSAAEKLGLGPGELLFVSARHGTNLPELVQRIVELLPDAMQDAFIGQQQANRQLKEKRARTLIYSKAGVAAGIALAPLPVADLVLITPVQLAMVAAIGYLHGIDVTRARAFELAATMGAGVGFREAARQLIKLVPGYGSAVSAGIAFAGTVALGESANAWFASRMSLDPELLRASFGESAARARREFDERARGASRAAQLRSRYEAGELTREELERALAELEDG